MIQYFFAMVPRLLFEPVAVVALLGCFTTLLFFHKKNNPFFIVTLLTVCAMFSWRISFYSMMISTRYTAIILYPAVIFNVLFCFHVKESVEWCNLRFFHSDNFWFKAACTVLPYFLLSPLVVSCAVKTLRFNPYADYRIKLCKTLAGEIKGKDFLIFGEKDHLRQIAHYSGVDGKSLKPLTVDEHCSIHDLLKKKLEETKNHFGDVYFIFSLRKGEREPDAVCLGIDPAMGKWECIYESYTSRRKNRRNVLYRFTPVHPNIEIWEKEIPGISPDNLCKNGDFEQALPPEQTVQRVAYYKRIGASDFYLTPGRLFPAQWWLGVGKPVNGRTAEMALSARSPIAGKYSLELKSVKEGGFGSNSVFIPKQDCVFSGFIRAESESWVTLRSCYWNTAEKKTGYMNFYHFRIPPGRTCRFSIPFRMKDIPEKDKDIYLIIGGQGHVLVDNVECIRARKEGTIRTEAKPPETEKKP